MPGAGHVRQGCSTRPAGHDINNSAWAAPSTSAPQHQHFYEDLIVWAAADVQTFNRCEGADTVEVSLRQKDNTKIYFLLTTKNSPVRIISTSDA